MNRTSRPANVRGADGVLELHTAPGDIVHLWVDKALSNPSVYIPVLNELLEPGQNSAARRQRYRFLGVHRDRKSGIECLCISFCLMSAGVRGDGTGCGRSGVNPESFPRPRSH